MIQEGNPYVVAFLRWAGHCLDSHSAFIRDNLRTFP